jgi:hypothetical protein
MYQGAPKPGDIQLDLCKRQLNLDKIFNLSKRDKKIIMGLYNDLMSSFDPKNSLNMPSFDVARMYTAYNTLVDNEYLVTHREVSLGKVLS